MAITYTWTVDKLMIKTEGTFTNSVVQTYWSCNGTDENGNTGTFRGGTPFSAIGSTASFVPYEQLTEEIVLGWIKDVVHADEMYSSRINEHILEQIESTVNAKVEVHSHELPWADTTATVLTAADLNPGTPKTE